MRADSRSQIITELAAEFVEERVRELPGKLFSVDDVKRALSTTLRDAGEAVAVLRNDDSMIEKYLDQHPFLIKARTGSLPHWKPGLNKAR